MFVGFFFGGEVKNVVVMFFMLLLGMIGLLNLLGMGGFLIKFVEFGIEEKKGNDFKELEGKKERIES